MIKVLFVCLGNICRSPIWLRLGENMKKGFTMVEILVSVMIIAMLVMMAMPMYERAVEKSHIAEVGATLKRMGESKLRTMESRNVATYSTASFGKSQLDGNFANTDDFMYSLLPSSWPNAVCAKRLRGDFKNTIFLFMGEAGMDHCDCPGSYTTNSVCGQYCSGKNLICNGQCDIYGMDSISGVGTCTSM